MKQVENHTPYAKMLLTGLKYLNEVGRKLSILHLKARLKVKGYLNEVGRKPWVQQQHRLLWVKGY